jgi:AhpC/TSA family
MFKRYRYPYLLLGMLMLLLSCNFNSKSPEGNAPEIDGEDLEGNHFKLSDYRGKVVLLDFWANF